MAKKHGKQLLMPFIENHVKTIPDAISVNTKLSTTKQEIANELHKYFATICANNHTPTTNTSYKSYLRTLPRSTFIFKLSNLNLSHSCGQDNLSTVILKCIANEMFECLTLTINQSITTGIFPDQLKNSLSYLRKMIKHILKTVISKIFENPMHIQLMEYFTFYNLQYNNTSLLKHIAAEVKTHTYTVMFKKIKNK